MKKSKFIIAILSVSLVLIVAAGSSLAYFSVSEKATNIITSGNITMILHDETTGGVKFPEGGIKGVMPGTTVDKIVYVENNCLNPEYVRVHLVKEIAPAEGVIASLNFDNIDLDIDTVNWTLGDDGWYYYNQVLTSGQSTKPLMQTVAFGTELGNEYEDSTANIIVYAQAVQSVNNGSNALEANGWPAADF